MAKAVISSGPMGRVNSAMKKRGRQSKEPLHRGVVAL
jgi:hypothetical protein